MTVLDFAVIAIVVLSALFALFRGLVRELVALASWVAALVLAVVYGGLLAARLPVLEDSPGARHVLAFALIVVAVLVVGAVVAHLLSRGVHLIGLGFLDRFLGAMFGVARGVAIVLLLVLVAGLTALPRHEWWQNAALAPALAAAALSLRPWLPAAWAERLDYSPQGGAPSRPGPAVTASATGGPERCAES